ncbi:MAG: hypothetical protein ACLU3U_06340 [Gallintestinimicrobium sp.]
MENIQNKSALIPSDEIRSEELLAEQKFEAFITSAGTYHREIWYESAGRG